MASELRATIRRLVVVGGGLAAARAVEEARRIGFDGELTLVAGERQQPYDRPPLSKDVLIADIQPEPEVLVDLDGLDVRSDLGAEALGVDVRNRLVRTPGADFPYDALLIATGSVPRTLDIDRGLAGVTTLRTYDDAVFVRERLQPGAQVLVIGAGAIGGELASSGRTRGADVTLVEAEPLPLERVAGSLVAERLAQLHRHYGVTLRTRVTARAFEGRDHVESVVLSDGTRLPADLVVVAIGAEPATSWLRGSGIAVNDGISCTPYMESTVPDVYAAGDVARWVNPWSGRSSRLEHWTSAGTQAEVAVRNVLSVDREPCSIVPYYWSEWYGHRLQMMGEATEQVELQCDGGSTAPFIAQYRYDGRLVGGFALDMAGPLMRRRRDIEARTPCENLLREAPVEVV